MINLQTVFRGHQLDHELSGSIAIKNSQFLIT